MYRGEDTLRGGRREAKKREDQSRFTVVDETSPILSVVFSKAVGPYNMEAGVTARAEVNTSRSWRERTGRRKGREYAR